MSITQPPIMLPHDIIEPAPIGWWPLAPGWWILIGLLLLALACLMRWQWRRWQRLAPLRQALREHQQIAKQWQQQRDARQTIAALSALLKRVARWRYPADNTAKLSGESWQTFLMHTGNGAFDTASAAALNRFYQRPENQYTDNPGSATETLSPPLEACLRWLKAQQAPKAQKGLRDHV